MLKLLLVGLGGFFGAIARYGVSVSVARRLDGPFPWGTLLVNVLGCLAIGNMAGLMEARELFSPNVRLLCMTGFLGALTTFSTFGYETVELLREGSLRLALVSVAANVVVGIAAVLAGMALAKRFGV